MGGGVRAVLKDSKQAESMDLSVPSRRVAYGVPASGAACAKALRWEQRGGCWEYLCERWW